MPRSLRRLLERCLAKDPQSRYRDIGDVRADLLALEETPSPRAGTVSRGRRRWKPLIAIAALTGVLIGGLGGWLVANLDRQPVDQSPGPVRRLSINLPENRPLRTPTELFHDQAAVLSPDGEWLVYVAVTEDGAADSSLSKRGLSEDVFELLPGTENAHTPFFSPDGVWVAFASSAEFAIRRVRLDGGEPTLISTLPSQSRDGRIGGGSWSEDDSVYFGVPEGIYRVAAGSGEAELFSPRAQGEVWRMYPVALPGGRGLLFSTGPTHSPRVHALDLETGETRVLVEGGLAASYVSGHLLYRTGDDLMAVGFDPSTLELVGDAVNVTPRADSAHPFPSVWSVANDGMLVYSSAGQLSRRLRPHLGRPGGWR